MLVQPVTAQEPDAIIRPSDIVVVMVGDQETLSGKYVVGPDGALTFPLLGQLSAAGLTSDQFAADLRRRLTPFLTNPEVRVNVRRAGQIFVLGAVRTTGPMELSEDMTVLEALARAGYAGTPEVVVVRPPRSLGPAALNEPGSLVARINLAELEKEVAEGRLRQNLLLQPGDTLYVSNNTPSGIYVSGEVRKPGLYSLPSGTTVLQALTAAGGATEQASVGQARIVRFVGTRQQSRRAKLEDLLEPGETLVVPERLRFPVVDIGTGNETARQEGAIRLGRAFSFVPVARLKQMGLDSNVLNSAGQTATDFTVVGGPQLDILLDLRRVSVKAVGDLDFVYYRRFENERAINKAASVTTTFTPSRRLAFQFGGSLTNTRERLNAAIDVRGPRIDRGLDARMQVRPWGRLEVELAGHEVDRRYTRDTTWFGANVRDTLTQRVQTASLTTRVALTPWTSINFGGTASTYRFPHFPAKNADMAELSAGMTFSSNALISGELRGAYLRYLTLHPAAPEFRGPVGRVDLFYDPWERTRFGIRAERTPGDAFQPQFAVAMIDRVGGSIRQRIFRRFDVLLEGYREKYTYGRFAFDIQEDPLGGSDETSQTYSSELGVYLGPTRIGLNVTYVQRLARTAAARNYDAIRMMTNFSYGAFSARAR